MRSKAPLVQATLLLLASLTIFGCSGGSGGGADASDQPSPTPTFQPQARFSAAPLSGVAPLAVQFTNESTLGAEIFANYTWVFGDGGVSNEKSPLYTYQLEGVYTVTLFVSTAVGSASEIKTDFVTVSFAGPPPVPDFSANPKLGVAPLGVQFTNLSNLGGHVFALYAWDFGDGSTSTEQHPSHTYQQVGVYTVSLRATTAGGTGTETKIDLIQAIPFVPPPVADFSAIPRTGKPPLAVQFSNLSNLNGAESATYLWDFGDGQTSTEQHPLHAYGMLGLFTVSLATTTRGGVDTETKIDFIDVRFPPPHADFSATPKVGLPPLHVQFTDLSDLNGAPDATYLWDFGDGQTSVEQDPTHDYTALGFYTVSLTITTAGGTDTETRINFVVLRVPSTFVLTFGENWDDIPTFMSLFVSAQVSTSGQVSIPGLGFQQAFSIVPGITTEISIPVGAMTIGSDITTANGIEVSASGPVSVYGLNRINFTTDAFAAFPIEMLGVEYYAMSVKSKNLTDRLAASEFAIVANSDNTTIQITPSATTGIRNRGVTYTIVLDRLEVYQLQADLVDVDLTATHIISDKPIAVFSGHMCADVPAGVSFCDYLAEQMPPVSAWGTDMITVPLATRLGGDTFRIIASRNDTTVTLRGASNTTLSLQGGRFVEINLGDINRIVANNPILVTQFANGGNFDNISDSDPFMMTIVPTERFQNAYTFATPTPTGSVFGPDFGINYINIVALSGDASRGDVLLDGVPVNPGMFTKVPGASLYSAAQIPISPLSMDLGTVRSHTVTAPNPLGLYVYGFSDRESYGFNGGAAF